MNNSNLHIAPTPSSPEVDFRFAEHSLSLRGESYPENAAAFYGELIRRLREYLGSTGSTGSTGTGAGPAITVNIALAYFNSSSTKMLFNMIEALNEAAEAGRPVTLHWFHDEEDETIFEFGEELREDFPAIEFIDQPVKTA